MKCYAKTACLLLVILSAFAFRLATAQAAELTGEIVYSSDGNIFTMDLASRLARRLTQDGTSTYPRWSPDGETIAYVSDGDIHLMDADGSNVRRLTNLETVIWYPVWSPDAEKIAFVASELEKTWNIYLVTIDDAQIEQLIEQPASWSYVYNDSTPIWSPNGDSLLFEIFHESDDIRGIYVLDVNTREAKRILENYPPAGSPTWSPDGELVAYFSYGEQDEYGLFVSGTDGNNRRKIDIFIQSFGRPLWSPDSELIAYSDGMNWYYSICIVLVNRDDYFGCFNDGSNVYRYPVWSPDGRYILFQQYADETDTSYVGAEPLKVLDVWAGKIYPLGVNAGEYMMDWRPVPSENNLCP